MDSMHSDAQATSTRTKTILFPPSSSALFQKYLRPNGSIVVHIPGL